MRDINRFEFEIALDSDEYSRSEMYDKLVAALKGLALIDKDKIRFYEGNVRHMRTVKVGQH